MFTQVGVIMLIGGYMVGGAFIFVELEQDSLQEQAITAENVRHTFKKGSNLLINETGKLRHLHHVWNISKIVQYNR